MYIKFIPEGDLYILDPYPKVQASGLEDDLGSISTRNFAQDVETNGRKLQ
jgi:hypothetical protein